jgi:hypothetical protein
MDDSLRIADGDHATLDSRAGDATIEQLVLLPQAAARTAIERMDSTALVGDEQVAVA